MVKGFAVLCPTEAIAYRIYDLYVLNGAIRDDTIVEDGLEALDGKSICLCYEYNTKRILYGSPAWHKTKSGLDTWNYYPYSNNIEEILLKKESKVIKKCMDS